METLSFVIGVCSLVLTIFGIIVTLKQRNRRSCSYQIVSSAPVVSVRPEFKSKVQVQFEGKLVEDAHQVILRIWNSGDAFIKPDEFIIPIKFNFGSAEVLGSPEILETIPDQLRESVSLLCDIKNENVTLKPLLLDKNESIKWKVLLTRFTGDIKVEGKIAGVRKIRRLERVSFVTTTYRLLFDTTISAIVKFYMKHL